MWCETRKKKTNATVIRRSSSLSDSTQRSNVTKSNPQRAIHSSRKSNHFLVALSNRPFHIPWIVNRVVRFLSESFFNQHFVYVYFTVAFGVPEIHINCLVPCPTKAIKIEPMTRGASIKMNHSIESNRPFPSSPQCLSKRV